MRCVIVCVMCVVGVCLLPGAASAADDPAACPTGAPAHAPQPEIVGSAHTYAPGDDPVVTAPATPTCDNGGYDIAFPDAALESDPTAVPAVGVAAPSYVLPRTDFMGYQLMLSLLGAVLVLSGILTHVLASLRELEAIDA